MMHIGHIFIFSCLVPDFDDCAFPATVSVYAQGYTEALNIMKLQGYF